MRIFRLLMLLAAVLALAVAALASGASAKTPKAGVKSTTSDRNHDRIPDRWERRFGLSLKVNQARRDQDRDGADNREEFLARTDPKDRDTDDDGRRDGAERAGTVASLGGGTLTIRLFDGGSVSAAVTSATEVECETARHLEDEAGDDNPKSRARVAAEPEPGDDHGADDEPGDDRRRGRGSDDPSDDDHGQHEGACPAGTLKAGAVVHEAKLSVTAAGRVWREIELIATPAA